MNNPAAPVKLRIKPQRDRVIAGEGIVLDLFHEITADIELETIELNLDRTRIQLTAVGSGESRTLTGHDHRVLHHKTGLEPIGRTFKAPAGAAWEAPLNLLDYIRPLGPGLYRIELSYRYGETAEQSVASNACEVTVDPARLGDLSCRWFGAADARGELATLWRHDGDGGPCWLYQTAERLDPGAVISSVPVAAAGADAWSSMRLALLNDIAWFHFERYAAWIQPGGLGWLKVQPAGPIGVPALAPHGLDQQPAPLILDPPLQCSDGGLCAVLKGNAPGGGAALSIVCIDAAGGSHHRILPMGEHALTHGCVFWHSWTGTPTASVIHCGPPEGDGQTRIIASDTNGGTHQELGVLPGWVERLDADQWLGRGRLLAITRDEQGFVVYARAMEAPDDPPGPLVCAAAIQGHYRDAELTGSGVMSGVMSGADEHALLLKTDDDWVVRTASREIRPGPGELQGATPLTVIAAANGQLFLLVDAGPEGPRAIPLDGSPAGCC